MDKNKLIDELRTDEGFVPHAYEDSEGYLTIGVGRLVDKRRGGGITEREAFYLLGNDIDHVENTLKHRLFFWDELTDARQRALVNMAFNLGVNGLFGFRKMLTNMEVRNYQTAAAEAIKSRWANQVGERAKRIASMIRNG